MPKTTRDLGGTLNARSAGCMPRNRKQAYNMKKMNAGVFQESQSKAILGSLFTIASDEKWSDSQLTFIRSIQTHPNPLFLVLRTTTQFQNLKADCTSELVLSVLTVDPSFNIGKYSVTPITLQDLLLVYKRTGEHPICIGPSLISHTARKNGFKQLYIQR